jgi:TetR/AcrR family transcriptional regulator, multidrug resistance operon repressor
MRTKDESKDLAIREKALEMIVNDGFEGLSMGKLARAANVSPATIYLYYKNREDLLNQLYISTDKLFADVTLKNFDPEMTFEEGMWLQWKNRFEYAMKYQYNFCFMEQFRSSPLINHKDIKASSFKDAMVTFFNNAIRRNELIELPVEVFWSIAYGPLYTLIRFHRTNKTLMGGKFVFDEKKMKQAFDLVMKALKKPQK